MAKKNAEKRKRKKDKVDEAPAASRASLGSELFAAITHAQRSSRTALSRQLTAFGLYAGQDPVMLMLADEDGQTLSAIAARLGVRAPTITKTVNRLAAEGFVEKRPPETDGRQTLVHLTETGRTAIGSIRDAVRASEAEAVAGLSAKDVKTLVKLLKRVDANLQSAQPDTVARAD